MKNSIILVIMFLNINCFSQALYLYGGEEHDIYLGCVNCDEYSSGSVWNEYGNNGNPYSNECIWNEYGEYGGEYSIYSPFNDVALYPPVVVDEEGNFYGYFTVNESNTKRYESDLALTIYKYFDLIGDNVTKWHEKIFHK